MSRILLSAGLIALLLGAAGASAGEQDAGGAEQPLPGELIIPEEMTGDQGEEKKQCMTVCARWGEECILINKGAGGMERKCRRTCQQFAEECF